VTPAPLRVTDGEPADRDWIESELLPARIAAPEAFHPSGGKPRIPLLEEIVTRGHSGPRDGFCSANFGTWGPSFTGTFGAAYTLYDFAEVGDLTARVNWYHQNEVSYGPTSETLDQGKYGLLGGQLCSRCPMPGRRSACSARTGSTAAT
jgi:hypothetical protein